LTQALTKRNNFFWWCHFVIIENLILFFQILLFLNEWMRIHKPILRRIEQEVFLSFFSIIYVVLILFKKFIGTIWKALIHEVWLRFFSTESLFASKVHLALLRTYLLVQIQFKVVHKFVTFSLPLKVQNFFILFIANLSFVKWSAHRSFSNGICPFLAIVLSNLL